MTISDDLSTPRSPLDEVIAEVEHNAKQSDPFLAVILDDAALYLHRLAGVEVEIARLNRVADNLLIAAEVEKEKREAAEAALADMEQRWLGMRDCYDREVLRVGRAERALDALRWRNNDGSYEDDCWCDVKNTDNPDWHSPRCLAARRALAAAGPAPEEAPGE